jgi:glycosyltransferase involved in cell wall biosynthesis
LKNFLLNLRKTMRPLVSILIPCYNAEKWLAETLESALAQTWDNIEIIVVDDGSTDNSLAIARKYESFGVRVIYQTNQGASAARNQALQISKGDFIQYLDADDLLAPNKIELQIQLLQCENRDYIAAGEWARFHTELQEAIFIREPVWNDKSPVDWLICSWEGGGMMHPAAWLVPRCVIEKAGFWDQNLSLNDDGEFFCRVILASRGVKFCSGAKSYYRSGISGSLSTTTSIKAWESAFETIELCTNYLLLQENSLRTRHACATAFQRFIYTAYPDAQDLVRKAEAKVKSLNGSSLKPSGGFVFKIVTNTLGWKLAKKLQRFGSKPLVQVKKFFINNLLQGV